MIRSHEGQDVFCDFGAPVLASQTGVVTFDEGGLGGRVARLHLPSGGYFYYAHLSEWNTEELASGDRVEAGDVIGYCGNTGNAASTAPHVHFGWYGPDGEARDPMAFLVSWLRAAERAAGGHPAPRAHLGVRKLVRSRSLRAWTRLAHARAFYALASSSALQLLWTLRSYPDVGPLGAAELALEVALGQRRTGIPRTHAPEALLHHLLAMAAPESAFASLYASTRTRTAQSSRNERTSSQPS
jgi:murein DD-endopeptidase MepM/ murein hydrolase activator NlpD